MRVINSAQKVANMLWSRNWWKWKSGDYDVEYLKIDTDDNNNKSLLLMNPPQAK